MAFGDFSVSRAGTKTVTGSDGNPVTYPPNFPAFEFNAGGASYRGVNTGDTDIWLPNASSVIGQTEGTILFTINLKRALSCSLVKYEVTRFFRFLALPT